MIESELDMKIRPVRDADSERVIALIDRVYREYGDRVHLEQVDNDLVNLEATYGEDGFWVIDDGVDIRGTVAIVPHPDDSTACFLKRLYLDESLRGTGWGARLLERACDVARSWGKTRMDFWTDVRFTRAHAFYEKMGFQADGSTRTMYDAWEPYSEYFYSGSL